MRNPGHAADHDYATARGSSRKDGDKIVDAASRSMNSVRTMQHQSERPGACGRIRCSAFHAADGDGTTLVVETDHIKGRLLRSLWERRRATKSKPSNDSSLTPITAVSTTRWITTDPVNFTRAFELKRYFVWKPESSVHPYECLLFRSRQVSGHNGATVMRHLRENARS